MWFSAKIFRSKILKIFRLCGSNLGPKNVIFYRVNSWRKIFAFRKVENAVWDPFLSVFLNAGHFFKFGHKKCPNDAQQKSTFLSQRYLGFSRFRRYASMVKNFWFFYMGRPRWSFSINARVFFWSFFEAKKISPRIVEKDQAYINVHTDFLCSYFERLHSLRCLRLYTVFRA